MSFETAPEVLDAIRADFVGGCCRDAEARREIGRLWGSGYLVDTHTAVAVAVLPSSARL